ncbi:hypothetical protein PV10_08295 [Exophiala mesophila]|uniref:RRM domain-containing protein n=1 Tax=Exophiala mesophila TaxID=212818 RepID=A0A0D1ZPD0_EXOME|nr:uncharacterized protein PV10_08295 [Exophiala mesophila]KIV88628.1 hypothetical protein PV10_08295 [Exophiala mesophila]
MVSTTFPRVCEDRSHSTWSWSPPYRKLQHLSSQADLKGVDPRDRCSYRGANHTTVSGFPRMTTGPKPQDARHWGQHALWVGNIAAEVTILTLRDYFSAACPRTVISIAYNSDARYAFVNFSSEESRAAAIRHAASTLFQGRRLDCRIRQGSMSRSTKVHYAVGKPGNTSFTVSHQGENSLEQRAVELLHYPETVEAQWGRDKFFILKSFSLEALAKSIETARWYVPKRHCSRLNFAHQTSRNVYFIFSINGSGSFCGLAKMKSETQPEASATNQQNDIHRTSSTRSDSSSLLRHSLSRVSGAGSGLRTPTTASSISVAGTIHYEPQRRRIVWEALPAEQADEQEADDDLAWSESSSSSSTVSNYEAGLVAGEDNYRLRRHTVPSRADISLDSPEVKALWDKDLAGTKTEPKSDTGLMEMLEQFGNPCDIEWISTKAISFDEIRGIKNAWNNNKEIQVARNVTAVEPRAATELLKVWTGVESRRVS